MTSADVLDRMAIAYAFCNTYRDSGIVTTTFIGSDGRWWSQKKPFTTAFVRPDRFRFEYRETTRGELKRYVVWRRGQDVRVWWDVKPEVEQVETLSSALAGATGVSGSSAHTVPALLLPEEVGGRPLTDITDAKRVDDASLGTIACLRIDGDFAGEPINLWIDKRSFLVRRIDGRNQFEDFRTEVTTTYEPIIDDEVSDQALEFGH